MRAEVGDECEEEMEAAIQEEDRREQNGNDSDEDGNEDSGDDDEEEMDEQAKKEAKEKAKEEAKEKARIKRLEKKSHDLQEKMRSKPTNPPYTPTSHPSLSFCLSLYLRAERMESMTHQHANEVASQVSFIAIDTRIALQWTDAAGGGLRDKCIDKQDELAKLCDNMTLVTISNVSAHPSILLSTITSPLCVGSISWMASSPVRASRLAIACACRV